MGMATFRASCTMEVSVFVCRKAEMDSTFTMSSSSVIKLA
jgi:hypothetical protein